MMPVECFVLLKFRAFVIKKDCRLRLRSAYCDVRDSLSNLRIDIEKLERVSCHS